MAYRAFLMDCIAFQDGRLRFEPENGGAVSPAPPSAYDLSFVLRSLIPLPPQIRNIPGTASETIRHIPLGALYVPLP